MKDRRTHDVLRKPDPLAAALSLACVLTLTGFLPAPGASPDNTTAPSTASGHRDATSIRKDFHTEITQITDETGGEWKYLSGTSFSSDDRPSFSRNACSGADDDGPRQLLLLLVSGVRQDGPAEIERMKSVLDSRGMKVTGCIPGKTGREASSIDAESTTGQYVPFGTNDQRTTIRFGSECSSDPTMFRDLD